MPTLGEVRGKVVMIFDESDNGFSSAITSYEMEYQYREDLGKSFDRKYELMTYLRDDPSEYNWMIDFTGTERAVWPTFIPEAARNKNRESVANVNVKYIGTNITECN